MATPQRTTRIEDEIWGPASAKAQADGGSLADLMRAAVRRYLAGDLTVTAEPASHPVPSLTSHGEPGSRPASQPLGTAGGIPSPGVACSAPTCWARDTSRYGLRQIPLCPADAAALAGLAYQRPSRQRPA